jgi:serine/threonine-protein kinase
MATKETIKSPPFKLPDRFGFTGTRLAGGQAFVYVCDDKFLNRKVALKTPRSSHAPESLRKELAVLREIRSRHIAEVYDVLDAKRSGLFAVVEEFVPGPTLQEHAEKTEIRKGGFLRILYQLACALSDIHDHGKVHRDVTPRNVRFDAENVLKVLDFGLSSTVAPEGITPHARGTPGFMGPEFYGSMPARFTVAADMYAFGATAWCLARKGKLPEALLEDPPQSSMTPPSFSASGLSLPSDIVALLDATLDPNPTRRPPAKYVRDTVKKHLLYGRHRATIYYGGATYVLSDVGSSARLPAGADTITIRYDGLEFVITGVAGDVYINNRSAVVDDILPESCVVTLGAASLGPSRKFVPVNMSHPEVVL